MEILHIFRTKEDFTEGVNSVLDSLRTVHACQVFCLAEREDGPDAFDTELFTAIEKADRVFCW